MLLVFGNRVSADEILINWDAGGSVSPGPGVIGETGDSWNVSTGGSGWHPIADYNISTVVDSTGSTMAGAAITLALIGNPPFNPEAGNLAGVGNGSGPTSNPAPFNFTLSNVSGFDLTVTLSGLPEATYDIYVFWGYAPNVGSTASVNGSDPQTFTYAPATASPAKGRDYLLFSELRVTDGAITISVATVDTNAGITGFQVEQLPGDGLMLMVK
jgi:hypothetical protein